MTFLKLVLSGFQKDFKLEFRTRYSINAIILFAVITLSAVSFSIGPLGFDEKLGASFFWIIIFFSSMTGLSHVFVREVEQKTDMALKLYVKPGMIFWSKFLFNLVLLFLVEVVIVPLFFFWFNLEVKFPGLFLSSLFLGSVGLSVVSTLIAGMIARAGSKSALFAILSFPILLPLLIISIKITTYCFYGIKLPEVLSLHLTLISYDAIMLIITPVLFKFIWRGN
ncbi:MAG: heme exporter protein CcmB [Calditrichia bacterium]|nr:heme exporter protein CcmB [Calditrichia bacterium]